MSALVNSQASTWGFATGHVTAGVVDAVSLPAQATAGNLIVVKYLSFNNVRTVSSIADTGGTTYARIGTSQQGGAGTTEIWWGIAPASNGGISVVLTLSGGNADEVGVVVEQYSGNNASQASAVSNGSTDDVSVGTHNSGSVTPPDANSITVATMVSGSATWTQDSNYTQVSLGVDYAYASYRLNQSSSQQVSNVSDVNRPSVMKIASFAGAAGSSPVLRRLLLGVG